MTRLPETIPPLPVVCPWTRDVKAIEAFSWLEQGWLDFRRAPASSLAYGLVISLVSIGIVTALFRLDIDYVLFPMLAAFMIIGPFLATGLYEKSRQLAARRRVSFIRMLLVRSSSGGQILFVGVLLCLLMLLWLRAAVIIYALFFGLHPFPGLDHVSQLLFGSATGWVLLITGSAVGGVFAAFSFAISMFSIPMLLDRRTDALTAMGRSMALVWHNLPVMLTWGAIVIVLFIGSTLTGLVGLILAFPILGHATWRSYVAMADAPQAGSSMAGSRNDRTTPRAGKAFT